MKQTVMQARLILSLWLALCYGVWTSATLAQPAHRTAPIEAVHAVGMTVSDMERSRAFYTTVLSFQAVSDVEVTGDAYDHLHGVSGVRMRVVHLRLGDEYVVLTEYLTPKGRPAPVDSRSHDRWFQHIAIVVNDMDRAYQWLRRHKVEPISTGPQRLPDWNPNAGGIRAFYFKDPDGRPLEILQFPPGKGDAKWQRPTHQLFLGIDHTAMVVGNTDASVQFYREVLGFKVVGESDNYGPEQEHLNNVFGARLRITTLRVASGPGIELLEYLTPRDGRPMPADVRANDLMHWQTTLVTPHLDAVGHDLQMGLFPLVSSGIVELPQTILGFARGLLVRDPDGHVMQLIEQDLAHPLWRTDIQ